MSDESSSLLNPSVAQVLDWYETHHVRPNVVAKDRQRDAINHLKAFFGSTPVKQVGVLQSRAYAEARRQGVIGGGSRRYNKVGSDGTIRRELNVLNAAAKLSVKLDFMGAANAPRIELPSEQRGDAVPWLTKAQVRQALDTLTEIDGVCALANLRSFILIAYYTAARRRSVEYLLKSQIDLKNDRIDLSPPGARRTVKRRPVVPLYPEIRPTIERLMNASDTEFLFGKPRSFYRHFRQLLAHLGIEANPHMLRHSRATHLLMDGEDIYKVAKLLGDSVVTVERVYGHHCVNYLATKSGLDED